MNIKLEHVQGNPREKIYAKKFFKRGWNQGHKRERRVYRGVEELPKVQGGIGVAVISTSRGLMTDTRAREARVGGEVMCRVW